MVGRPEEAFIREDDGDSITFEAPRTEGEMQDIHAERLNMAINGSGAERLSGVAHVAACNTCRARLFSAYATIDRALRGEDEALTPTDRDWPHHYDTSHAGNPWMLE